MSEDGDNYTEVFDTPLADESLGPDPFVREQFLKDAYEQAEVNPVELSVRKLLSLWGHHRRGLLVAKKINQDLAQRRLQTDPPFISVPWIDGAVTLRRVAATSSAGPLVEESDDINEDTLEEVGLRVGSIDPSNRTVMSVNVTDDLCDAETLMGSNNFSQLAVLSPDGGLRGAVTWESIAQTRLNDRNPSLAAATIEPTVVQYNEDLIPLASRIVDAGFAFVMNAGRLSGIITAADLSHQLAELAGPFIQVGEIERRLRQALRVRVSVATLSASLGEAGSIDDLTLGGIMHLIDSDNVWEELGWTVRRAKFIAELNGVRRTRNDVAHFNSDPLEQSQIEQLARFTRWMRMLDPHQ